MAAEAVTVRAAANEAYRALCALEDVLDGRVAPLDSADANELHLLRRRWELDTAPKIKRAQVR